MKKNKLREQFESLRRKGSVKSSEMEKIAKLLGRKKTKRGKEPTWINPTYPDLRPLSIPHHSGDINRFTSGSILDQLEEDLEKKEESE